MKSSFEPPAAGPWGENQGRGAGRAGGRCCARSESYSAPEFGTEMTQGKEVSKGEEWEATREERSVKGKAVFIPSLTTPTT